MKQYLVTALTLAAIGLIVALAAIKRGDDAQHQSDASAFNDVSNQLVSAHDEIAADTVAMMNLSNHLERCQIAATTFSNQWADAQSIIIQDAEQFTNLNRQIAVSQAENQTISQRIMDLTNQNADLSQQITLLQTNLFQANTDCALLENRLRRDVAARVVVERKFNNLRALQAQVDKLKKHPTEGISADSIYAGLGIEVSSNSFHVISTN